MWNVKKSEVKSLFTGAVKKVNFEVRDDNGNLYSTLDTEENAKIVAYGLNNGFNEHITGGFADSVVSEIKKAMANDAA